MTQRINRQPWQASLPWLNNATGGTTGGERETSSESHLTLALYHWPRGLPGPPPEEVFWGYWLNDEVVNAEIQRMADPD